MRRHFTRLLALSLSTCSAAVFASTMAPPHPRLFVSAGGDRALKIIPHRTDAAYETTASLFQLNEDGTEKNLWTATLLNTPNEVLVSPTGKRVVTLDNYGSQGGDHALVVYDEKGKVLADYKLEDLLTKEEIEKNVAPLFWTGRMWLTPEILASLRMPDAGPLAFKLSGGKVITINLDDGKLAK